VAIIGTRPVEPQYSWSSGCILAYCGTYS